MRLGGCGGTSTDQGVSIHASVKDATNAVTKILDMDLVSIHASVKDATFPVFHPLTFHQVSIHASVKDATYYYYSA